MTFNIISNALSWTLTSLKWVYLHFAIIDNRIKIKHWNNRAYINVYLLTETGCWPFQSKMNSQTIRCIRCRPIDRTQINCALLIVQSWMPIPTIFIWGSFFYCILLSGRCHLIYLAWKPFDFWWLLGFMTQK